MFSAENGYNDKGASAAYLLGLCFCVEPGVVSVQLMLTSVIVNRM